MTDDVKTHVNNSDETLLLVSGSKGTKELDKEYVKKLANAVTQVFAKHETAKMRCVGAGAINNAVKAFIIAKEEANKKDSSLLMSASFTTVDFDGGEKKTGVILEVVAD